jgi:hypothetical protein
MVREAKALLTEVIHLVLPDIPIVLSAAEESRVFHDRRFPFIALITNPGSFDESEARTVRRREGMRILEWYVRGYRNLPIVIRCWALGEDACDAVFSRIIPAIPRQWEYAGYVTHIKIGAEEHTDNATNLTKPYLSVVEVTFVGAAVRQPTEISVIETVETEYGEKE